jgi:hypothetical protein
MQKIRVKIEFVKDNKFNLLAENVELTFEDGVTCEPLPKTKVADEALRTQHSEIFAKIPLFAIINGYPYRCGLCYTREILK